MTCCEPISDRLESRSPSKNEGSRKGIPFDVLALILAAFIAGNTTVATLATNLSEMSSGARFWIQAVLLLSCLSVTCLLAPQILRNAASNLRRGRVSVDLLFAMGASGGLTLSIINFVRCEGPVYFEVFNVLLVIYALGSMVKRKAQKRVLSSVSAWKTDRMCQTIDQDGVLQLRPVENVVVGDRVVVAAGKAIPVDGKVLHGKAFVNESAITGEPNLKSVTAGDFVKSASLLTDAALEIEATSCGDDRSIDHVQRSLHQTISQTSRWQSAADQVSRWFTPMVAILSLSTFVFWTFSENPGDAAMTSLAVLLVACPCAFGFATPVAVWVSASRLASIGWRAASGEALEKLAEVDTVVLDKTGTLTVLQPTLKQLIQRADSVFDREMLLTITSSLQAHSSHPIASVFSKRKAKHLPVHESGPIPGVGIRGTIAFDGKLVQVEIGRLQDLHRPCCDKVLLQRWFDCRQVGEYPVAIRIDEQLEAIAVIDEQAIDSLQDGLTELRNLDLAVQIHSGDQAERVARLGVQDFEGNLSASGKAERVQKLTDSGSRVLFIGDGINDTVAMARAHVSAAAEGASDLASSIADFQWQTRDLRTVAEAIAISRRSKKRLRGSLLFSICYNTIGVAIAATGFLHPVIAVLLMMSASLTVVLRAADFSQDLSSGTPYRPDILPSKTTRRLELSLALPRSHTSSVGKQYETFG